LFNSHSGLNLKSSSSNFFSYNQSELLFSINKFLSKSIFNSIVANFLLKYASSLELISFSNVFHLKHQKIFLVSSSLNLSRSIFFISFSDIFLKLFASIKLYIVSIHQIIFIKSIAFLGQNQSIQGILSALSPTIAK
jgi:hypothetical protein